MKKLETENNIIITCIEGSPKAEILKVLDDHILVYASNGKMFRINKTSLIEGETEIQAIDFEEEIVIPDTGYIPVEMKKAMVKLSKNIDSIEKKNISSDVSAFRFEMGKDESKTKEKPREPKAIPLELIDFIKSFSDNESGTQHGIILSEKGHLGILALAIEKHQVYESMKSILSEEKCPKAAFTVSCKNNVANAVIPGDFTHFQKIYTLTSGNWFYGVLPYKYEKGQPITFGEVDWANEIWSERMELELMRADIVKKLQKIGTAYGDKIIVKKYVENTEGYFYEGTIDEEKIDDKLKSFLYKHDLKINNREKVNEYLSSIGKGISLEKDKFGYFTVRCGSFVASGKRSKTRAYLEALEYVVAAI